MIEKESNLLNDFEDKYLNKKRRYRCCLIILLVIILIAIAVTVVIFCFFKTKKENIYEPIDNPYTLDTILDDELNQARNSFFQYYYNDAFNPKIIISYNFFIPENYTNNMKYPLILFIGDESTFGNEISLPINKSVGGPIWATKTIQEKHNCFILVPHYKENIFNMDENIKNEYLNIIIRLINKISNEYSIDSNRIYGTGQSLGADAILYLIEKNPKLFAATLIIEPNNFNKNLINSIQTPFTYFSSKENISPYNIQIEVKNIFKSLNITFGSIIDINPQEKIEILNQKFNDLYINNYIFNFITYSSREIYDNENKGKYNEIEIYKYGYRPEASIDWIFSNNKIICDKDYYYSEEKGKCFSKKNKKIYFIRYYEDDVLINILKNSPFISEVKLGSADFIPKMTYDFMKSYDCIIYGLRDSIYSTQEKKDEIKSYINSGGAFLVTHDKWEQNLENLKLIGLGEGGPSYEYTMTEKAKVSRFGHPIFDSYNDLTDWRQINVAITHSSHKAINDVKNTARVVMEIEANCETGEKLDYLTVNEIGKGRIAYWGAGHSNRVTNEEKKLLLNIISWLTHHKQ